VIPEEEATTQNDGPAQVFFRVETLRRVRACRLDSATSGEAQCDEPLTIHRSRSVTGGPKAGERSVEFTTSYHLDGEGHVVTAKHDDEH
jgi:hypothetical protein